MREFFRPKETKGREDSIWFPGSERPSLFSLPARESPETACESQRWIVLMAVRTTTGLSHPQDATLVIITRRYGVVKVLSLPYLVPTLLVATIRK